jgi:predicted phosphate transport protein (TIGR00153 family)
MRFRLVPSNDHFFDQFSEAARNACECVTRLRDLADDFTDLDAKFQRVKETERRGDELTRDILRSLDTTFVTPFDREDIHALAENLDDVVDDVYHLSEVMVLVTLESILPELREQIDVMVSMATRIVEVIDRLESMKNMRPLLEEIDALESHGDEIYRRTLGHLFSGQFETLDVIKWKDIVQAAESAINRLEDVADVVASILVKHA